MAAHAWPSVWLGVGWAGSVGRMQQEGRDAGAEVLGLEMQGWGGAG